MAEQLFNLTYNGQIVEPSFRVVEPGEFRGKVKPSTEWPSELEVVGATLEVFTTPIDSYTDLEDELRQKEGRVVKLGEVVTRSESGGLVEVRARAGNLYDIFCVARRADGTGAMFGGGRYAVTDNPEYKLPNGITLDEAKFFGYTALGLSDEHARGVEVRITPMTGWGDSLPGRFVIAGLDLNGGSNNTYKPGIMVSHLGGVEFYHGRSASETLEAAGLSRR